MLTDIEIAKSSKMKNIQEIAEKISISEDELELYGRFKAKINLKSNRTIKKGKIILVTATNPTPFGEGKTTTSIGLIDSINKLGKTAIGAIREPSLGPVFGKKGGACGGGYSQVVPMEDINLHFTGDLHAIGSANNLLCAMIDNHIKWGNELDIKPDTITIKRSLDINERQLREITSGLGGELNGTPREDGFEITVASEVMAIFCLSNDIFELKENLGKIIVGYNSKNQPVTASDLGVNGAMTALLKDAIKPNLVQTLENNPVIIHGGPFANIAHGCNSIIATKTAQSLGDYAVTEAGFGSDLGAEKFFNIKCRKDDIKPSAVVIVTTIRALKYNGNGVLENGISNLEKHIENMQKFIGNSIIIAINKFADDTENELDFIADFCSEKGVKTSICTNFTDGSNGSVDLAEKVIKLAENEPENINFTYELSDKIEVKIEKVCKSIYGASEIIFSKKSSKIIKNIKELKLENLPICIAKTQYSLSDNPELLGKPNNFKITIKDITICAGAGFITVITGDIIKMPGLPKEPAALKIDIDKNGNIVGLT